MAYDHDSDPAMIELRRSEREDVREITVHDLGPDPWEKGMAWIDLRLNEHSGTGLKMNPSELADLRDKIDAYLAALPGTDKEN